MSCPNSCFLTHIEVSQDTGKVVWYLHFFKNFPQFATIHTVKGFSVAIEAEVDVFFWNSLAFSMILQMLAIWSLVPLPLETQLSICKFSVHIVLEPSLEDFERNLVGMWNEHSCMVIWTFLSIALLWDWNATWHFPVLCPLLSFQNLLTYWVQHFNCIISDDLE